MEDGKDNWKVIKILLTKSTWLWECLTNVLLSWYVKFDTSVTNLLLGQKPAPKKYGSMPLRSSIKYGGREQ